MSKSYNNAVFLSDPPDEIRGKVSEMITDPQRARRSDPGDPAVCNVFSFHQLYSDQETIQRVDQECREAKIGCVECKQMMAENLIRALEPIREKRSYYEAHPDTVRAIIEDGDQRAQAVARKTMEEVRAAVKI
jgi:tryptophanyl-tRNA synthetase